MFKKIICFGILFIMVFSLAACNQGLAAYKEDAKLQLEGYAAAKGESNYSTENWNIILNATGVGKKAIDDAKSKADVNTVIEDTKSVIDEVQKEDFFMETVADNMIELHTWVFTSGVPNNAIKFQHTDDNAVFECTVDNGQLFFGEGGVKALAVKSGDTIYWHDTAIIDKAFISIIVKVDDKIEGYGVIKITQNNGSASHTASVLKKVLFPKVNGDYQNISEEQVKKNINEIINNG